MCADCFSVPCDTLCDNSKSSLAIDEEEDGSAFNGCASNLWLVEFQEVYFWLIIECSKASRVVFIAILK